VQENGGFFNDIKEFVSQKVILGLLPQKAGDLFNRNTGFKGVKSVLVVAEPNDRSSCWNTMKTVIEQDRERLACEVYAIDKSGILKKTML
jgi:hypothetical protein